MSTDGQIETATLAGGCFWCIEAVFVELNGVSKVVSGYSGGKTRNPSYREVCSGDSGHAEVARVTFDPEVLSFADLLRVFFTIHDLTTLNRQGNDVGSQYRSAVFTHSDEQKEIAEAVIAEIEAAGIWSNPIVTEVTPIPDFYAAEDYHQDYYQNNSGQMYCRVVIEPKVLKFRKEYADRLKVPV
jgi:peptide-methionine (S)-S-oxide reductase